MLLTLKPTQSGDVYNILLYSNLQFRIGPAAGAGRGETFAEAAWGGQVRATVALGAGNVLRRVPAMNQKNSCLKGLSAHS